MGFHHTFHTFWEGGQKHSVHSIGIKSLNQRLSLCSIFLSTIWIKFFPNGCNKLNLQYVRVSPCFDWILIKKFKYHCSNFYNINYSFLTVTLICIFLIASKNRHLLICLGLFVLPWPKNVHLHFCLFLCCVIFFLLILHTNPLLRI